MAYIANLKYFATSTPARKKIIPPLLVDAGSKKPPVLGQIFPRGKD